MSTAKKSGSKSPAAKSKPPSKKRWSGKVTRESDALDLEPGVFRLPSGRAIAESLKRSSDRSTRRKASPYQSAMSMLNFYINRGGTNLSASRRLILERAKRQLKKIFDR